MSLNIQVNEGTIDKINNYRNLVHELPNIVKSEVKNGFAEVRIKDYYILLSLSLTTDELLNMNMVEFINLYKMNSTRIIDFWVLNEIVNGKKTITFTTTPPKRAFNQARGFNQSIFISIMDSDRIHYKDSNVNDYLLERYTKTLQNYYSRVLEDFFMEDDEGFAIIGDVYEIIMKHKVDNKGVLQDMLDITPTYIIYNVYKQLSDRQKINVIYRKLAKDLLSKTRMSNTFQVRYDLILDEFVVDEAPYVQPKQSFILFQNTFKFGVHSKTIDILWNKNKLSENMDNNDKIKHIEKELKKKDIIPFPNARNHAMISEKDFTSEFNDYIKRTLSI